MKVITLLILQLVTFTNSYSFLKKMDETYRLIKSASLFHISIAWDKATLGNSFNFNQIINPAYSKIKVNFDTKGNIISIDDGNITPLVLGSIPKNIHDLKLLQKSFNLSEKDDIGIYSLNMDFEVNWTGLTKLIKDFPNLHLTQYPTYDFSAPSIENIQLAINDLENRDQKNYKIAYVHCKAGRGRSAVLIACYLMHICNKANIFVTVEQIYNYLKTIREQVHLNSEQLSLLHKFHKKLNREL